MSAATEVIKINLFDPSIDLAFLIELVLNYMKLITASYSHALLKTLMICALFIES